MTYILAMEQYVDRLIQLFCDQMDAQQGRAVNMTNWTQFFAFDVVGELAFGQDFGLLKAGSDFNGLCHRAFMYMTCTSMCGWAWQTSLNLIFPWWHWLLNSTFLSRVGASIDTHPGAPFAKVSLLPLSPPSSSYPSIIETRFEKLNEKQPGRDRNPETAQTPRPPRSPHTLLLDEKQRWHCRHGERGFLRINERRRRRCRHDRDLDSRHHALCVQLAARIPETPVGDRFGVPNGEAVAHCDVFGRAESALFPGCDQGGAAFVPSW
jgi:Cytochrome P450